MLYITVGGAILTTCSEGKYFFTLRDFNLLMPFNISYFLIKVMDFLNVRPMVFYALLSDLEFRSYPFAFALQWPRSQAFTTTPSLK